MKYIKNFKESSEHVDVISILERDCKPFLDELSKYQSNLIFRGYDTIIRDFELITAPKNRKPKDMNPIVSDKLDNLFFEYFGYYLRSEGVFATKVEYVTETYGHGYIFFPKGEYKYFWNKDVEDLYARLSDDSSWYYDYSTGLIGYDKEYDLELEEIVNGYQDSNLEDIDKQEITFICDKYYLVNIKYLQDIKRYIIERKKRA